MVTTTATQETHYARSLIEASLDPLVTISIEGKIMDANESMLNITDIERKTLLACQPIKPKQN